MQPEIPGNKSPPKYALSKEFVIGCFQEVITFINSEYKRERTNLQIKEKVSEVLRYFLAPIRPYGCVFYHLGGAYKSIMRQFQLFEKTKCVSVRKLIWNKL